MAQKIIADLRIVELFESKKYYDNARFRELMGAVHGYYNEPYLRNL